MSDNPESLALYERVLEELVSCYGEGEDTDWPYLCDLAALIVSIVERESSTPENTATPTGDE